MCLHTAVMGSSAIGQSPGAGRCPDSFWAGRGAHLGLSTGGPPLQPPKSPFSELPVNHTCLHVHMCTSSQDTLALFVQTEALAFEIHRKHFSCKHCTPAACPTPRELPGPQNECPGSSPCSPGRRCVRPERGGRGSVEEVTGAEVEICLRELPDWGRD